MDESDGGGFDEREEARSWWKSMGWRNAPWETEHSTGKNPMPGEREVNTRYIGSRVIESKPNGERKAEERPLFFLFDSLRASEVVLVDGQVPRIVVVSSGTESVVRV